MLDITGSMQGQKLTDLKSAAGDAIDILIWADQSKYTSKVAITPFAQDVRLPTAAAFQVATGTAAANAAFADALVDLQLLHDRMGHLNFADISKLPQVADGVVLHAKDAKFCESLCADQEHAAARAQGR